MVYKILHLSDGSLPDWRIEKAALSSVNQGYQVYFAGVKPSITYKRNIFLDIFNLPWNSNARYRLPFEWYKLKKQLIMILKEVRPDIIHAHNIFAAKIVKEIGDYPFVYDNHEYWSKFLIYQYENSYSDYLDKTFVNKVDRSVTKLINNVKTNMRKMWIKWELDILPDISVLVPSKSIVKELSTVSKKIFFLPNYPLENEIKSIPRPEKIDTFNSVYAGTTPYKGYQTPIKNIDGFVRLFEEQKIGKLNIIGWKLENTPSVIYHGFLDRKEMIEEMSKNSIGIIPWKKHPFHPYCNPNKAYEYAHAGLVVVSINSLKPVFDDLMNNVVGFEDYPDMVKKIKYLFSNKDELYTRRMDTYNFARANLLWENHQTSIFEAYKQV